MTDRLVIAPDLTINPKKLVYAIRKGDDWQFHMTNKHYLTVRNDQLTWAARVYLEDDR